MNESQRRHFEQRLLQERDRTSRALVRSDEVMHTPIDSDGDLTLYPRHQADQGTDAMEQEKALLMMSQEGIRLAQINDALRRVYNEPDAFGRCARCGNRIATERLDIVPWAVHCLNCQAIEEGREA